MVAAVSKLMRNQDLILAARKVRVVTRFRDTIGLDGRMAVRIQPNHPTDDPRGIAASVIDGLMFGCGDAVIGVNPASDNVNAIIDMLNMLDRLIDKLGIPRRAACSRMSPLRSKRSRAAHRLTSYSSPSAAPRH